MSATDVSCKPVLPHGGSSVDNTSPEHDRSNLLYQTFGSLFTSAGTVMHARGWSVFPQERTGKRMPARIDGAVLQWGRLREERATRAELDQFCRYASDANVAVALGKASGHTFAIDIDCMDPAVSDRVRAIAGDILGKTVFRRVGRAPKVALIYRYEPETPPKAQQHRFLRRAECMLEILGAESAITMYGLHHVTGRWFQWEDGNPLSRGPEEAPVVSASQLAAFVRAVEAEFPFERPARDERQPAPMRVSVSPCGEDEGGELVVPGRPDGAPLSDGREAFLRDLAWNVVRLNAEALLAARDAGTGAEMRARIEDVVEHEFRESCEVTGRWTGRGLGMAVVERVGSAVEKLMNGQMTMAAPRAAAQPSPEVPSEEDPITDEEVRRHRIVVDDAMEEPRPPLDHVLPGLLVGSVGFLVSPGGAGKSFLALGLSTSIALGKNMWGLLPGAPVQGPVLFQGAEDPAEVIIGRLHDLATVPNGCGVDLWKDQDFRRNMILQAVSGEDFSLGSWTGGRFIPSRGFRVMQRQVELYRPRLVILDTLSRCLDGIPENDNSAMAALIKALEKMLKPLRAACLILHHVGKSSAREGSGDEQQAARGAGAITDNGRWQANVVTMTRAEAETHGIAEEQRWRWVRLVVSKVNHVEKGAPRWLWRDTGGVLVARELPRSGQRPIANPGRAPSARRRVETDHG